MNNAVPPAPNPLGQDFFCVANLNFPPTPESPPPSWASNILARAINMNATTAFQWRCIDKPSPGTTLLVFLANTLPPDGIRYATNEQVSRAPVPEQSQLELEVASLNHGFCPPSPDASAEPPQPQLTRYRKRFRLSKGGIPNLCLFYWGQTPPDPSTPSTPPQWMTQQIRNYPLPTPPNAAVQPLLGYQNAQKMREHQQQQQQQQQMAQSNGMPPPPMALPPQIPQSQQAQAIMMQNHRRAMEQQTRLSTSAGASPGVPPHPTPPQGLQMAGSPPRPIHRAPSMATLPPMPGPSQSTAPTLHPQGPGPFANPSPMVQPTPPQIQQQQQRRPGSSSMPMAPPALPPSGPPAVANQGMTNSASPSITDHYFGDHLDLAPSKLLNNQRMLNNQNIVSGLFENALSTRDILAKVVLRDESRGSLEKTPEQEKARLREEIESLRGERAELDKKRAQTRELINQARSATWAC